VNDPHGDLRWVCDVAGDVEVVVAGVASGLRYLAFLRGQDPAAVFGQRVLALRGSRRNRGGSTSPWPAPCTP
jgi:hypothetical protein